MIDWTDYFARSPRVAKWTLFDAPEQKEKPEPKEPKKKPKPPKEPPTYTLFEAPPEKPAEPAEPAEVPPAPPAAPPKAPEKPAEWDQFLDLFYEGGKKKVPNPNPKTKKKYPEVQVSTALKDPTFHKKLVAEYEAWLAKESDVAAKTKKTEEPISPHLQDLHDELKEEMKGEAPEGEGLEKLEEKKQDFLEELLEVVEEIEQEPKPLKEGEQVATVSQLAEGDWVEGLAAGDKDDPWIGQVRKVETQEEVPYVRVAIYDPGEHKLTGVTFVMPESKVEAEKVKLAPDPDKVTTPSDVKMGEVIAYKYKGKDYVGRVVAFEDGDKKFRVEVLDPETGVMVQKKLPSFDEKKIGERGVELVRDWMPSLVEKHPASDVDVDDIVYLAGKPHRVKDKELDPDQFGFRFRLENGVWVNHMELDRKPGTKTDEVYVLPGPVAKEKGVKLAPPAKPQVGQKVTSIGQLVPGLVMQSAYGTFRIQKVDPDGSLIARKLDPHSKQWAAQSKKLDSKWLHHVFPNHDWKAIEDPAPKPETPDPFKMIEGLSVGKAAELKVGDFVSYTENDKESVGEVAEVGDGLIMLQDYDRATGEPSGKPWLVPEESFEHRKMKRAKKPEVKAKPKETKPKKEGPAHPKPKKGTHLTEPDAAKVGDTITWEHEGKTHVGRVTEAEGHRFYVQTADPKTGKLKDFYVLAQYDLDRLPVAKVDEKDLPEIKMPEVPPKPKEPKIPKPPEKPKGISKPSDVKIGDEVEWELGGKTYRGKVVKFEEDGRFRAEVTGPKGSKSLGKTPSFDEKKIADRDVRVYDPEKAKAYEEAKAKHEKEVAKLKADHAEKMQKWEAKKAEIEGAKHTAKRPIKREYGEHLPDIPDAWDPNHTTLLLADTLVPVYAEKHKKFLEDTRSSLREMIKVPPELNTTAAEEMWEERPEAEKMLAMGGHLYGDQFFDHVLTPQERESLSSALKSWQGNPKHPGGQRLLGVLEGMGVEGQKKSHDTGVEEYREEGRHDKVLQSAIAKAIAYSRAVFDSLGVDHITLYRGGQNKAVGAAEQGDIVPMPNSRELTGFSTSPQTAYAFGDYRMKAKVPVSRVFISPVTVPHLGGPGSSSGYDENEFLIAGLAGEKVKRMGDHIGDYDADLMKMASRIVRGTSVDEDEEDELGWHRHMLEIRERAKKKLERKEASRRLAKLAARHPGFRDALLFELRGLLRSGVGCGFAVPRSGSECVPMKWTHT